jgi:TPR repeat protein
VNILEVGTVLNIPSKDAVAAIDSAEADKEVRELLAAKPAAAPVQVAAVKPQVAAVVRPAPKVPAVQPGQEEAARRYQDGLAMERKGDHKGALAAFLAAGEAGYGPALRKLGQIYDKGTPAASRDYQTALMWYQKAREQGVEMAKPIQRMTPK